MVEESRFPPAIVTAATAGIDYAIARAFGRAGFPVALVNLSGIA